MQFRRFASCGLLVLALHWSIPLCVRAAEPKPDFSQTIAKPRTVAPPSLAPDHPPDPPECTRTYLKNGAVLRCDSYLGWDGEGLRQYLREVPDAEAELNAYQAKRKSIRNAAYFGTIGVLLLITGGVIATNFMQDENGQITKAGKHVQHTTLLTGLLTLGGTAIYGFGSLRSNESRLGNAVQLYNQARPQGGIELQFGTGILF